MLRAVAEEVRVREPWILVVGSVNVDLVAEVNRLPATGETVDGSSFAVLPGGKGANQAAAAARLGQRTALLAQVGDDNLSEVAWRALQEAGVGLDWTGHVPGASGTALILVAAGQNTIAVVPGANATLTPAVLDERWAMVRRDLPAMVLAQLETPLATVERLGELCVGDGVPLVLDPAPAQDLPEGLLRCVTWLTPNETEAERISGMRLEIERLETVRAVGERLLAMGPRHVALKLGAAGVWLAGPCGEHWVRAPEVNTVDTTAAGDCWNGAFATGLLQRWAPERAARWACVAAALSTTRRGAMPSLPGRDEVDRRVRDGG